MPDGIAFLVLLLAVGLIVLLVRSSPPSRGGAAVRPPRDPVAQPRVPATSLPPVPESGEDFDRDEDEFAVFADEGDE